MPFAPAEAAAAWRGEVEESGWLGDSPRSSTTPAPPSARSDLSDSADGAREAGVQLRPRPRGVSRSRPRPLGGGSPRGSSATPGAAAKGAAEGTPPGGAAPQREGGVGRWREGRNG